MLQMFFECYKDHWRWYHRTSGRLLIRDKRKRCGGLSFYLSSIFIKDTFCMFHVVNVGDVVFGWWKNHPIEDKPSDILALAEPIRERGVLVSCSVRRSMFTTHTFTSSFVFFFRCGDFCVVVDDVRMGQAGGRQEQTNKRRRQILSSQAKGNHESHQDFFSLGRGLVLWMPGSKRRWHYSWSKSPATDYCATLQKIGNLPSASLPNLLITARSSLPRLSCHFCHLKCGTTKENKNLK